MFAFSPFYQATRVVGFRMALLLRLSHYLNFVLRELRIGYRHPIVALRLKDYPYPIWGRIGSSDALVLDQIFIQGAYAPVDTIKPSPEVMIDCGANIGFSSLYFLHRYPHLKVIVVEPDNDNISLCRKNLAPYSGSVQIVHKGVWSRTVGLRISGEGWATKVREAGPRETPDISAIDIPSLLAMTPRGEADLLKVDIEWSELAVFGETCAAWLPHIRNIAIELHDAECENVFFRAMEPYHYDLSRCGDLTFCRNIHLRAERIRGASDFASSENDLNGTA